MATLSRRECLTAEKPYFELGEYYVTLDFVRYADENTFRYTPVVKYFDIQTERMLAMFEFLPVLNPRKAAKRFYRYHRRTCRTSSPESYIFYDGSPNHEHDESFVVEL